MADLGLGVGLGGRDRIPGREAAIKVIPPADGSATEPFRREAMAAARLRHPGIVTVYDFGETETGRPFPTPTGGRAGPTSTARRSACARRPS